MIFLPDEIKTQVKFPKAIALSEENLRYLDQVRQQTTQFMSQNIPVNYFTGESNVGLEASLQEAEVMFSANDNFKQMAASGELQALHQRFNSLEETANSEYNSIRDRLNNLIVSIQAQEDAIVSEAQATFPQLSLSQHNSADLGFSSLLSARGFISCNNIEAVDKLKAETPAESKAPLVELHERLHALLEVQIQAIESLIELQEAWIANVEDDAATQNELSHYKEKLDKFRSDVHSHHTTSIADSFSAQVRDASSGIAGARSTFEDFSRANNERTLLFQDYRANQKQEVL